MKDYPQGSIVVSEVHFRDEELGIAVDPETVEFYYLVTNEAPSTVLTYTNATIPAVGTIARLGVGWYKTWIDATAFVGVTGEFWDGLGANQAPGEKQFNVVARGSF